jgi:hydro-lyases, Fe-S type, tartrate/fumarate subfamily, beta region
MEKRITAPFSDECVRSLKAGDNVLISGVVYTARDAAHVRMAKTLAAGGALPVDLRGQVLYYLGPAPAKPGHAIGSAGPTSSYRMDANTPALLELGLKGMIGKGRRGPAVIKKMQEFPAVYLAATGGAAALLAKCIVASEVVAYEDLGTEAIRRLEIRDFPAIVAVDCYGGNQYETGPAEYLEQKRGQGA